MTTRALWVLPLLILLTTSAMSQGSLTPPGAPNLTSPSMPALNQVESRVFIETLSGGPSAEFIITEPGSYVLSGHVSGETGKHGIEVLASNVTIDLNGFSLAGVPGSLDGIYSLQRQITVLNGAVRGWGSNGINIETGARVERVRALGNSRNGISVGNQSLVIDCQASQNAYSGMYIGEASVIRSCIASNNSDDGLHILGAGGQVLNSVFDYNGRVGIYASAGGYWLIQGNTCYSNQRHGIDVCFGNSILDNVCSGNGAGSSVFDGAGINVRCGSNFVRGNLLLSNDVGIATNTDSDEVVIQNSAAHNSAADYVVSTGNDFGHITTASGATAPFSNIDN